jgi:hypothetical protein
VVLHVCLGKLDTYGKDTDGQDDTGEFQRDGVDTIEVWVGISYARRAPGAGINDVGSVWTYNDAKEKSPDSFADVKPLTEDEGEHAEL